MEKITRVQDAEELARTLIADAKAQASDVINKAQKDSASLIVESRDKTQKEVRTAGTKFLLQARQENEVLLSETVESIALMRESVNSRREALLTEATELLLS